MALDWNCITKTVSPGRIVTARFRTGVVTKVYEGGDGRPMATVAWIDHATGRLLVCPDNRCVGDKTCPICSVDAWLPEVQPWTFRDVEFYADTGLLSKELADIHEASQDGVPVVGKPTFAAALDKLLKEAASDGIRSEVVWVDNTPPATDQQIAMMANRGAVEQLEQVMYAIEAVLPRSIDRARAVGAIAEGCHQLELMLDEIERQAKAEKRAEAKAARAAKAAIGHGEKYGS